jgi:hypothetical protein
MQVQLPYSFAWTREVLADQEGTVIQGVLTDAAGAVLGNYYKLYKNDDPERLFAQDLRTFIVGRLVEQVRVQDLPESGEFTVDFDIVPSHGDRL